MGKFKQSFTHNAKFYGIPCYWNDYTGAIQGKNCLFDIILGIAVWIEVNFPSNEFGFPIQLGDTLDKNDRWH